MNFKNFVYYTGAERMLPMEEISTKEACVMPIEEMPEAEKREMEGAGIVAFMREVGIRVWKGDEN